MSVETIDCRQRRVSSANRFSSPLPVSVCFYLPTKGMERYVHRFLPNCSILPLFLFLQKAKIEKLIQDYYYYYSHVPEKSSMHFSNFNQNAKIWSEDFSSAQKKSKFN
jgi:hypothetical protein